MSAFSSFFSNARDHLKAFFGQQVSYEPIGGSAGNVTMNVLDESATLIEHELPLEGRIKFRSRMAQVYLSEVPVPRLGDRATIGTDVWTVREIPAIEGGIATIRMECPVKIEDGGRRKVR